MPSSHTTCIDRDYFFAQIRDPLFDGALTQRQVDGLNGLLDHWESHHGAEDPRWLAYALATVHHEVNREMRPIREFGGVAYFRRMYDIEGSRPHIARRLGNDHPGDGAQFCGRGFVQITGRTNYARWARRTGLDLVGEPDLTLRTDVAARILFEGMIEGTFTGRKLSDYFCGDREEWTSARRIVNGVDRASLIAGYARSYDAALIYCADARELRSA
ncbi:MAG: hypothetical protein AAF360_03145 [Pseudomonadota bacterium]